jgi:hypothetical protein
MQANEVHTVLDLPRRLGNSKGERLANPKLLIPELRQWTDLQAIVRQFKSRAAMLSLSKSNAKANVNISRSNWTEGSY